MTEVVENIYQFAGVVLLICALYYYIHFLKIKKERKLTKIERFVYTITQIAFFLFAFSSLLKILAGMD